MTMYLPNDGIIRTSNLTSVPALLVTAGNMTNTYIGDVDMKSIPLTQGKFALVDDEDYDRLIKLGKWCFNGQYATRKGSGSSLMRMHRVIVNAPAGYEVDHINMDKLDNRKCNLRICTRAENQRHKGKPKRNTTGYIGIHPDKRDGCYYPRIMVNWESVSLGCYKTPEEAARAYDEAAKKYHGEFASLNFPEGTE
jgi:hypothetical protein